MLDKIVKKSNQLGFTLIELMIIIAIIGILSAIAVSQFDNYRLRTYNAAARAIVNNMKVDEVNLLSELGVYGHTEETAHNLTSPDAGHGVADSFKEQALRIGATNHTQGARLVGTTNDGLRKLAISIVLGVNMIADVQDINAATDDSAFHAFSRHYKGDTAYGVDSDIENVLYSVSNPTWLNTTGIRALTVPPAIPPSDNINGAAGGGVPSANWTRIR